MSLGHIKDNIQKINESTARDSTHNNITHVLEGLDYERVFR